MFGELPHANESATANHERQRQAAGWLLTIRWMKYICYTISMFEFMHKLYINFVFQITELRDCEDRFTNKTTAQGGMSLLQPYVYLFCITWIGDIRFVMPHKSWITAGFATVCCSMSLVSKTSCSHFVCQGSYYDTHTLGLNFTNKFMSWISGAYECHYAWPLPEANATTVVNINILIAVTRWAYAEVCTGTEQEGCTHAYIVGT